METLARNGLTETYITSFEADKTDKHLRLNFCAKTVSGLQSLTIYAEKGPSYVFDRILNTPLC